MDYEKLGKLALRLTREALAVIELARKQGRLEVRLEDNPYVRSGKSPTTPADIATQRIYTEAFEKITPAIGIIAEEKDPERKNSPATKSGAVWVVDGIDGTSNLISNAPFGYGTQCALLLSNGTVPIAIVGDGATGDIFGYYGKSGVFRITKQGRRTPVQNVNRQEPLANHAGLRRPPINLYHPLSQRILLSGDCGTIRELSGGIGTTMAGLLTDEIGLFALRPHHERPWDAIPAYALCERAGIVFMTPTKDGKGFEKWQVKHSKATYMRNFDLLAMHESRVNEFLAVAQKHA